MARLALLLLFAASPAFAQPRREGGPRERRGPPPSALAACQGQEEGAACSFDTPRGREPGSCYDVGGQIACIPADAPRPPRRAEAPPQRSAFERLEPPTLSASSLPEPKLAEPVLAAGAPAPVAVQAPAPASPVLAEAANPAPPTAPGFPWTGLFAGLGGAAGIYALWKTSNAQPTAPVTAPPPPAPRGTAMPALPDSVPTAAIKAPAPAPVSAPASPPAPLVFGPGGGLLVGKDYEIRREIGAGGMGVVYEAVDLKLDRRVALKKLRAEIGMSPRGRERFLSEAKTVAKLQHRNIVTIHGIIEEEKDVYLVFEYVDGETLDDLLGRHTRLTSEQALSILRGVADAVDYAHEQKVIHRDLKPANIMIDKAGHAKVMDFGIAHQAKLTISQLTMAEAYGTLAYMPPEQELGKAVRESDVYAFAALTYESLTGVLPFPGPNFHLQKESMSFTRPSFNFPPLQATLDPVFERAFQVEPKKRYPTTGEFARALQGALAAA